MSLGMVVLLASFGVIDRSWSASKKISDREDALQRGRIALELMTRELHSMTCAGQTAPVSLANDSEVDFYAYMGDPTAGGSTNPSLHKLVYSTSNNGTITDSVYAVTDLTTIPPTVSTTASSSRRLLANIGQIATGTPIFSYYTFDSTATQGSGTFLQLSTNSGAGLTSTDLPKVVKVAINFKSLPTGSVANPPTTNFQDDVFWRAVDPESPNSQPCTQGT
jgi:Tfp pilus assembly protein PilW